MAVLAPVRLVAGGSHQITVALQPEGLGTVRATVTVNGSDVQVHLATDNAETRQVLAQSLPDLRQQLSLDGGRAVVVLQLGTGSSPGGDHAGTGTGTGPGAGSSTTGTPDDQEPTASPASTGHPNGTSAQLVDLRL